MSLICNNGVDIPELLPSEPCKGDYVSTACVAQSGAITALNLPANSTQQQINTAFVLALQNLLNQIEELTARVEVLETP